MKKWIYQILAILFVVCSASSFAVAEVDCNKVYMNVDLSYNLANKVEATACCRQMCGGIGGIDSTGSCCCSSECGEDIPPETESCQKETMCCFDTLESYNKNQDCCELNERHEYVASYYNDSWGDPEKLKPESQCCMKNEPKDVKGNVTQTCCEGLMGGYRNGNVWAPGSSNGEEACCKQGYPTNYEGKLTKPCCEYYGIELIHGKPDNTHEITESNKNCYFYEDPILKESGCCSKDHRRNCDNSKFQYAGDLSFVCCYAAGGEIMIDDKRVPKGSITASTITTSDGRTHIRAEIENNRSRWVCCKTFGYRGVGATECSPKDGVTSDFDDKDIDCSKVVSNVDLNYNLSNRDAAAQCCWDYCGGGIDNMGACNCGL